MTTEWMRPRTPKSIVGLAAVAAAAGALWVSSLAAQDNAKKPAVPEVLARVGDQTIDRDAVIQEASKSLQDVEAERLQCQQAADRNEHEALQSAVERVVHRRIFALEAERRGMTEDALREELKAKTGEVTDAEVDAFYEANTGADPAAEGADRRPDPRLPQAAAAAEGRRRLLRRDGEELQGRLPARAAAGRGRRHRLRARPGHGAGHHRRVLRLPVPLLQARAADARSGGGEVRRQGAGGLPPLPAAVDPSQRAEGRRGLAVRRRPGQVLGDARPAVRRPAEARGADDLKEKATRLGLDAATFGECLDSGRHAETVAADLKDGAAAGVTGTPAFFINGRFLSGAVPFESMAELIDDEVRRAERD